jgi:inositol transporter-like SP family MFS transporter
LGRQRVFTLYILFYALGMAVMTLSVNEPMLFAGMVIAGLAAGADLPTSVAVVSERAPAHAQGRLVSTTQLMWTFGIAITMVLAFVFSKLDVLGARLIFAELAVVAIATWAVRRFDKDLMTLEEEVVEARRTNPGLETKIGLKEVFSSRAHLVPMGLTALFYIFWGMVANTFGQFQTYFLITVGGASQTLATGLSTALIPIAIIMSLFLIKFMDTKWRNTIFVVGALIQVAAMVLAGFGNGVIAIYVGALALFNIGAIIAGEANYKVWTQESFPLEVRATVQGLTYGVGRFVFAIFALFTPPLLAANPNALLYLLVLFSAIATVVGIAVFRYLAGQGIHPGQAAQVAPSERAAVAGSSPAEPSRV